MLLPENERFHKLAPKDVLKADEKPLIEMQLAKQTTSTGEQIVMNCPMYASDTREELNDRIQMCFSIMQERMEEENKVLLKLAEDAKRKKKEAEEEAFRLEEERKEKAHQEELRRIEERNARKGKKLEAVKEN